MPGGRPKKEFDKKQFGDLVGLGCTQEEICWFFRGSDGKPVDVNTLSNWCKREFGQNFSEYAKQNRAQVLKIQLRRNQLELSKRSAAMAIFLGKQYLGQRDQQDIEISTTKDDSIRAMEKYFENAREDYKGTP